MNKIEQSSNSIVGANYIDYVDLVIDLINRDICNKIINESDLNQYIDTKKYSSVQIDNYLLNCIQVIKAKPKLLDKFIEESIGCVETKYHKENLITHLYCVGWICCLFADKFDLDPEYAFKLGFFHDIGKPWAKKYIQTKKKIISTSKAHAQIGENIGTELGLDSKICWCIGNHMCSCCHENNSNSHWEYVGSLQCLSFNPKLPNTEIIKYANSLACLMIGDDLGRLGDQEKNIPNIISHSDSWLDWFKNYIEKFNPVKHSVNFLSTLHPDNSIIVQMYGHSGFGKSTCVKNLISILDSYNISWEFAERDKSYYNVYQQETGTELLVNDNIVNHNEYKMVYEYIETNELKYKVQQDWVQQLNAILDSNSKVKIIDTVQLMYPKSWDSTLESLDPDAYSVWVSSIKFGFYGFPQYLYGHEFIPKTGKYELIPRGVSGGVSDGLTWPNINSELDKSQKFNPVLIDIGYGSIELLANSICNYNSYSVLNAPDKQIHLINILDNFEKNKLTSKSIQEYIQNQFPPGIVTSNEELVYYSNHLIRFSYKDGMQIFNGPTRDYRGETLLFDSSNLNYYIGRVSLPVFPDYSDIRKDPTAQDLIKTCNSFHIVPKFDGSLFVLALVKSNTPEYTIVKNLLPLTSTRAYVENDLGIWCFGSKGCMFAKDQFGDTGVLSSIINSINSTYNSIENFINKVSLEIQSQNLSNYTHISAIFEAIDLIPNQCLTVDYGRAFCPFLCWVVWDGTKKQIILPNKPTHLSLFGKITTVDTWEQVIQFKESAHTRLLEGSESDEPEGYVVWLGDSNIGIKLKHPEYYVAHKPYSKKNIEMAKQIEFSEEYSKLRPRLVKFKPKPPIKDLIKKNLEFVTELFLDNYKYINSKKNWALFWKDNKNLKKLNKILDSIETDITVYYPQFKNSLKEKGFSIAIDYFDKRDEWKEYFFSKYLKT